MLDIRRRLAPYLIPIALPVALGLAALPACDKGEASSGAAEQKAAAPAREAPAGEKAAEAGEKAAEAGEKAAEAGEKAAEAGEKAAEAPTAAVEEKAAEAKTPPTPEAPALPREEIAKLALLTGELACLAEQFPAAEARASAEEAALTRAGLTRAQYDERVAQVAADVTYVATVQAAQAHCKVPDAEVPAEQAAMRDKLKALAVASACLQKAGKTSDEMASAMLAMYKAYGISLEVYTTEMGKLAGDRDFQAAVQAAIAECPTAEEVAAADGEPGEAPPDDEAGAAEEAAQAEEVAEAEPEAPAPEKAKAEVTTSGRYAGSVSGSHSGSVTVRVQGRSVTASASIGGVSMNMTGQLLANGHVNFAARKGNDYMRFQGKLDKSGRMTGSWRGALRTKTASGKWSAAK